MSPLRNSRPVRATAAWLCAAFSVGCTAAQVRPLPDDCPQEALQSMQELKLEERDYFPIFLDINQPGTRMQQGVYRTGKITGRVIQEWENKPPLLPDGTLLYGQLWTEGLTKYHEDAVYGRYTEALLPDGRRFPVCLALHDETGARFKEDGSKPGQARLPVVMDVTVVRRWQ